MLPDEDMVPGTRSAHCDRGRGICISSSATTPVLRSGRYWNQLTRYINSSPGSEQCRDYLNVFSKRFRDPDTNITVAGTEVLGDQLTCRNQFELDGNAIGT